MADGGAHDLHQQDRDADGRQQMLYKHAISTIVPIAVIDLKSAEESEE